MLTILDAKVQHFSDICKEPLILLMKGSENGGYLSRSVISCMTVALRHWALDPHPLSPQIENLRGPR
jgi:hypothetical protein